jgi:hypothetical protein
MIEPQPGIRHGSIIHIGAGGGAELEGYLAGNAERIILVEPEPDRAAALERRCASDPRTLVIAAAMTGEIGEAELKTFNIRALDGLHYPEHAKGIYPGLRILDQMIVPTLSPAGLLERIGSMPGPVRLILHATGMEADILNAWPAGDALAQIDRVELRCSASSLFEGGSDMAGLRELLQNLGLDVVHSDMSDPDWPKLVLRSNPLRLEFEARLSEAETARQAAAGIVEARDIRIHELESQLSKLRRRRDAWRAKRNTVARAAKKSEAARVAAEGALETTAETAAARDVRIKELEAQLAEAEAARQAAITNAAQATEATQAEADRALKSTTDGVAVRDIRIKELDAQLAEAEAARQAAITNAAQAIENARVQAEAAQNNLKARTGEQATARADLAVALRMQAILQSDLRDLQIRYAETLEVRQQQENLLRKLTPRLQEAARHIQDISALQSEGPGQLGITKPKSAPGRKPKSLPGAQK